MEVTRDKLKKMIDSGADFILVEVLTAEHFDEAHIAGAVSLPVADIPARAASVIPDKNKAIVTYCAHAECDASKKGAEALRKLGYTNVREYTEGKADWKAAGFPMEGSACFGGTCSTTEGDRSPQQVS